MLASVPPRMVPMLTVVSPSTGSVGSGSARDGGQQREHRLDRRDCRAARRRSARRGRVCARRRAASPWPRCELALGGLAVDEEAARRLEMVGGARAIGALLLADDEQQVDAVLARGGQALGGAQHRRGDALGVARAASVQAVFSRRGPMYGGTVSRCVESVTPRPARDAQTFARPLATSWSVTFQPRAISQRETKSTAGLRAGGRLDGEKFGGERDDVSHSAKSSRERNVDATVRPRILSARAPTVAR